MDHRFTPANDKLTDAPHPKLVIEIQFPYEDGVTHDDLDEALVETSFVVLAAFEDGKIKLGEVEDALGNPFLSWRLEESASQQPSCSCVPDEGELHPGCTGDVKKYEDGFSRGMCEFCSSNRCDLPRED